MPILPATMSPDDRSEGSSSFDELSRLWALKASRRTLLKATLAGILGLAWMNGRPVLAQTPCPGQKLCDYTSPTGGRARWCCRASQQCHYPPRQIPDCDPCPGPLCGQSCCEPNQVCIEGQCRSCPPDEPMCGPSGDCCPRGWTCSGGTTSPICCEPITTPNTGCDCLNI
jgi:hypothetical protein